jgi:prevent-host-death family protein
MQVVNIKELKARLSAYLREVGRGETFLVTDRNRVVARLSPAEPSGGSGVAAGAEDLVSRLTAIGCRPPLRGARSTDYLRSGPGSGLTTAQIDELLASTREESR